MRMLKGLFLTGIFGLALTLMSSLAEAQTATYTDLYDFNCQVTCYPGVPNILTQGTDGNFYGMACDNLVCNNASIFQLTPSGQFTLIHQFNGETNNSPGVTLGSDGAFYGVTAYGGAAGLGTIFKITSGGVFTTMHEFKGTDGQNPSAPPVLGDDGFLYGVANYFMYKISPTANPSGQFPFTVLASSLPGSNITPLLLANDGSFYGTDPYPAGNTAGLVFRVSPGGSASVIYTFQPDVNGNYPQGERPYGPLVQQADGTFYGTTYYGGVIVVNECNSGCGVVYQLTQAGSQTVLYDFLGGDDGQNPYAGIVAANDGNLYGATTDGVFFRLTNGTSYEIRYALSEPVGLAPYATPIQATNGMLYGLTSQGGFSNEGVFYSLDDTMSPLVSTIQPSGQPGQVIGILGKGFTSSSKVLFHGVRARIVSVSDTYLTAKIPATATTGPVTVDGVSSNRAFRIRMKTTNVLTTSGSPSKRRDPVTFTATVTAPTGSIPDGELVTFTDKNRVIGTGTTAGGAATVTTTLLPVGTHTIRATYEGDGSYVASVGTVSQIVQP